ncbi:hypothetical protein [Bowmanella yangjiangensis]|uniref:Uncharacterized protein n=1 Tax=Bowmanella yangjiangensis TaxID=2811230 RepID=A0ABS3CWH0_9ALTE|nr:hypothetical protein [Bowmanella yangjiangensis]MBN7820920.1 hypothetical protein [Bowmanella yangjiangensis]
MVSDLLFPILPKQGKTNPVQDEQRVEQVSKEAKLRSLEEDDRNLTAEERQSRQQQQEQKGKKKPKQEAEKPVEGENRAGPGHLDIYI